MAKAKRGKKTPSGKKRKTPSKRKKPASKEGDLIPKHNLSEYLKSRVKKLEDEVQSADPQRRSLLEFAIVKLNEIKGNVEACFTGGDMEE